MVDINKAQNDSIRELVAQSELVDFIDVELFDENDSFDEYDIKSQINEIHRYGCRALLSYHDFEHMPQPGEIVNIIKTMNNLGADICKLAAMANSREDAENLLKATALLTRNGIGLVVTIAMGEWGRSTRVAAGRYGSCIDLCSRQLTVGAWADRCVHHEEMAGRVLTDRLIMSDMYTMTDVAGCPQADERNTDDRFYQS